MVDWANIYFAGRVAFALIGTATQLVIIFIIWKSGGFKS